MVPILQEDTTELGEISLEAGGWRLPVTFLRVAPLEDTAK